MKKFTNVALAVIISLLFVSVNRASVNVPQPVPVANFYSSDTVFCADAGSKSINFFDLSTGSPTSWNWSFPGASPAASNLQNPTAIVYSNPGTYSVTLIVSNISGSDTLTVAPMIKAGTDPGIPSITIFGSLIVSSILPSCSYQWYCNGSPIIGATNTFYNAIQNGFNSFSVMVTNYDCPDVSGGALVGAGTQGDNIVTGKCFIDYNHNGIQDAGEPNYNIATVVSTGSGLTNSSWPDSQGVFLNFADTGTIQTTIPNPSLAYSYSPSQHTSHFTGSGVNTDTVNFAFVPLSVSLQDLRIDMIPLSRERVGTNDVYRLIYFNAGTDTMTGIVYLIKDSRLVLVSSSPNYSSVSGDSIGWNYSNLLPLESRTIDVTLNVPSPPTVNVGDMLSSSSVIEPVATDSVKANNYVYLSERSVGSHDPNDKNMLLGDSITTIQVADSEYLTYVIRFQNTGTDIAYNVIIIDTLDSQLDGSTFEMVSSSNVYTVSIQNQQTVEWIFKNVLLPDSAVNQAGSQGYVCFKIRAKSSVSGGDVINNDANILFDANSPVATNTVQTSVIFITSSSNIEGNTSGIVLFPNPASENLNLYLPGNMLKAQFKIFNMLGELKYSSVISSQQTNIDISGLANGVYLVEVITENNILRQKFIKQQ